MQDILSLLLVWFVISFPVALFIGAVFQLNNRPFDGLSCPRCGADEEHIEADEDEFKCKKCGHTFMIRLEQSRSSDRLRGGRRGFLRRYG